MALRIKNICSVGRYRWLYFCFLLEEIQVCCPLAFVLPVFLRFFIRLKFSGLDYGFTMEDQGMCIIFYLLEISAQIFVL